ncbi:hypothetical protein [Vibrio fluvialis]|uniref:hypothetical protein n=1 Tax=Vibrio fluvialis TaxID=676 RepID=UPI0028F17AFF|nr:hypothetical protein [Vibrio fluvialis]
MLEKYKSLLASIALGTYLIIMITLHRYPDITIGDMANIFVALGTMTAIAFSFLSISNQRKQWLNDSFIKFEAEQLLNLRKNLDDTQDSIRFFINIYLQVEKKYGNTPAKSNPTIKYQDIVKHFNKLNDLNTFFNSNQHIFRKHGLEKKLECIALIMEPARSIPEKDIEFQFYSQEGTTWIYRPDNNTLCNILSFNHSAHIHFDVDNTKSLEIDTLNQFNRKDQFEELKRLRNLTSESLHQLIFDLNLLTTYSDTELRPEFHGYSKRFFTNKTIPNSVEKP